MNAGQSGAILNANVTLTEPAQFIRVRVELAP